MDFFDIVAKRHSYREAFTEAPVPKDDLVRIVQAGIDAPSACNAQSPSFVIVDNLQLLEEIRALFNTEVVKTAKAMILCIGDSTPVYRDVTFYLEDIAAAVENMLLAITALGYATVWYEGYLAGEVGQKIGKILGVPENLHPLVLLPIGIPAKQLDPKEKKPFAERAWFNKYGQDTIY